MDSGIVVLTSHQKMTSYRAAIYPDLRSKLNIIRACNQRRSCVALINDYNLFWANLLQLILLMPQVKAEAEALEKVKEETTAVHHLLLERDGLFGRNRNEMERGEVCFDYLLGRQSYRQIPFGKEDDRSQGEGQAPQRRAGSVNSKLAEEVKKAEEDKLWADDLAAKMTTAMDRWKAFLEGQAYNQELYVVAIHVLINFMEKRP
ncbi:Hypothetical predicted protein [Olea europaea subsp. europaea]|uniref:Uncharacterized protein n=1 Tax=Olea europaea subsp. europaea TaxID=158383 RepID=A0A8S0V953_OLEEU|nr:Hypothetical predicted protein [Olea europaea subsp. europaea]